MAARDRYPTEIKCPECGEQGTLHLSEDDHPYMKKLHRQVDRIDGNFSAHMKGDSDVSILCKNCSCVFIR